MILQLMQVVRKALEVYTDAKSFQNVYQQGIRRNTLTGKKCLLYYMHSYYGMKHGMGDKFG